MAELEQFAGRIVDVQRKTDGDTLAVAAASGATTLTVHDTADFDETGGQLLFAGDVYVYDEVDDEAGTIHLTTPTTIAGSVDDPVDVFSEEMGTIVVEYVAHVLLDENDPDDEPLEVTVQHALVPMLREAVRGGAEESVTLIRDGDDDLMIWQVDGKLAVDVMANEAVLAADAAMDLALQGLTAAQLAQAMLDGEVNIHYLDDAPWSNGDATHDDDTADIWVDTDAPTDTAYRWLSRTWTLIGEASLVSALLAARSAQVTLDGKIRRVYKTYEPVQDGADGHFGYGDSLIRTDLDNKEFFWDGDSWAELLVGTAAIAEFITGKTIRTALDGNRIQMRQDGAAGVIEGFTGLAGETPGILDPLASGSQPGIQLKSGTTPSYPNFAEVYLTAGSGGTNSIVFLGCDKVVVPQELSVSGGITGTTNGTHNGPVNGDLNGDISGGPSITGGMTVTGTVELNSLDGTGGSSFVMVGNDGVLARGAPSSMRYKENVKPLDARVSEALLQVDTITWQYKDRQFHGDRRYAGVPAEQLHDLGLDLFVDYDRNGKPDQVRYWELVAPLIGLCQQQQAQIDALAARVEALEQ